VLTGVALWADLFSKDIPKLLQDHIREALSRESNARKAISRLSQNRERLMKFQLIAILAKLVPGTVSAMLFQGKSTSFLNSLAGLSLGILIVLSVVLALAFLKLSSALDSILLEKTELEAGQKRAGEMGEVNAVELCDSMVERPTIKLPVKAKSNRPPPETTGS